MERVLTEEDFHPESRALTPRKEFRALTASRWRDEWGRRC
jgi:hypothetical protein